ncbi:MAG: hypothetical protein PHY00_03340 [Bacilli bacterium]|nr:hypothetical protein [Bacilli bacterium]
MSKYVEETILSEHVEEIILSEYVEEILNYPNLTKEETEKLILEKKFSNPGARESLIKHNLKIVVGLANEFQGVIDLSIDELINIGAIGLIEAIDKFDGYNDIQFTKAIYLNVRKAFCNYLTALNNIDGNLYDCYDKLVEHQVPYKDANIYVKQESIEDIILENETLDTIEQILDGVQSQQKIKKHYNKIH